MEFTQKPTCRIFCKTDPSFTLTIKNNQLILAPADPKNESQFWYKKFPNSPVLDVDGVRSFILLNKFTDQAIKRATEQNQPLSVVSYNESEVIDISLFWSEAPDTNDGYTAIRPTGSTNLCFDAQRAESRVENGTSVVLWTKINQNNQLWKIEEYPLPSPLPTYKITCKGNPNLCITIKGDKVVLAKSNVADHFQHWYKYGEGSFCFVNNANGEAIRCPSAVNEKAVRLIPFYNNLKTDSTLLWNAAPELVNGYGAIRTGQPNGHHHFYAQGGQVKDGVELVTTTKWDGRDSMRWKIIPY